MNFDDLSALENLYNELTQKINKRTSLFLGDKNLSKLKQYRLVIQQHIERLKK